MKIDHNNSVNQRIKGDFVAREVKTCFSYEMEAILRAGQEHHKFGDGIDLPNFEDIENLYEDVCEECGEVRPYDDKNGGEHCECGGDFESQPQEIFEWWIVTDFLYRKLKALNEPVLAWGNNYYWGRTCTGQAILLDRVIDVICKELEILEGQQYDWSKNK